jgi:hypothetical protein
MTARTNQDGPIFVRRSTVADIAELARLAALSGKAQAPQGVYLVAEVGERTVAAVSLARTEEVLHDPAYDTSTIQELLRRWGRNLRREATRIERQAA